MKKDPCICVTLWLHTVFQLHLYDFIPASSSSVRWSLPTFASPLFYSIPSLISLSPLPQCLLCVLVFLMSFLDFVIEMPKTAGGKNRTYKIIWAQTRVSAKALSTQTIVLCVTAAPSCFCLPLSSFCPLVCCPSFFLLLIHLLLCLLYFL